MTSKDIVKQWNLNKQVLAQKMNVNNETLKQKLIGASAYVWTELDEQKLRAALILLADDIKKGSPVDVIKDWRMNRTLFAERMKVDHYHFRMKLLGTHKNYKMSKPDIRRLQKQLDILVEDIMKVAGKRVIDGDRMAIIEMFDPDNTDQIVQKYQQDYEDVGVDADGDIIIYKTVTV